MANNNYLIDLEKQLQEETFESIALIDEEIIKLSSDYQCSLCLKKLVRYVHTIQGSLRSLGLKLHAEHFEKIEMLLGFLAINNMAINMETLKIAQKGVKLISNALVLNSELNPNTEYAGEIDRKNITIANAEIGRLLSELKKNRKPGLKLDKDLHDDFIYDSKNQLTFMTEKFELSSPNTSNESLVTDLFRSLHTLKSSASIYGYKPIEEIVHELENILTFSRDHGFMLSKKTHHYFQKSLKLLIEAIDELSDLGDPSSKIVDNLCTLIDDLRQYYTGLIYTNISPLKK
jgi:chemotaxis protein histidine kinase CheA